MEPKSHTEKKHSEKHCCKLSRTEGRFPIRQFFWTSIGGDRPPLLHPNGVASIEIELLDFLESNSNWVI